MNHSPRDDCEHDTRRKPYSVLNRYFLDSSSGLYVPESARGASGVASECAQRKPSSPLDVNIRRDWLIISISVVTLIGLGLTVYFTKRQWQEAQRSATAAENAVDKAQKALDLARDNFRQDQRPYIWFTAAGAGAPEFRQTPNTNPATGQIVWTFHYTTYGKTPAYGFQHIDQQIRIGD